VALGLDMRTRATAFPDAQQKLVALERGPVVLARDMCLGDADINTAVACAGGDEVPAEEIDPPAGFWLAFSAPVGVDGQRTRLCDYSSAGATWDRRTSDFRVWLPTD
jgi:hypothetical protein